MKVLNNYRDSNWRYYRVEKLRVEGMQIGLSLGEATINQWYNSLNECIVHCVVMFQLPHH